MSFFTHERLSYDKTNVHSFYLITSMLRKAIPWRGIIDKHGIGPAKNLIRTRIKNRFPLVDSKYDIYSVRQTDRQRDILYVRIYVIKRLHRA